MNKDLQLALYFVPQALKHIEITEENKKMFVEWASQGKHKEKIKLSHFDDGFNTLVQGKKWAGITAHELWEPGLLDGSVSYWTLLGGEDDDEILPKFIVDWMKREMFKGKDANLIEELYRKVSLPQSKGE